MSCDPAPCKIWFLQGSLLDSCWAVCICSSCLAARALLHAGSGRAACLSWRVGLPICSPCMSARLPQHAAPCLQVRFEFDEPDFAMIDTLFSLAEAHLFMQLVELQDSDPGQLPAGKNTDDLYRQALAWLVDTQGCCAGKELEFWMHFTQSGCWPRCKISSCTLPAAAAAWVSEERRHVVQAGAALAWLPVGCMQDPARCSHCAAPSDCAADKQSPCSRAVSEGMGWLPHQQDQILSGHRAPAACRARTGGQIIAQVRQRVDTGPLTAAGTCAPPWTCATATVP